VILPTTYPAALLLLLFSWLCLGSWANSLKLSGKWRFELFYYDYSMGAALCALVAAFTLGSMNSHDLTFQDNLLIASRHAMAYAFGAGMILNLANLLLLGAMQVSAMAIAFPLAFGVALVIGAISNYVLNPSSNGVLLFSGAILTLIAVVVVAIAHVARLDALSPPKTALRPDPRAPRPRRPQSPVPGIVLGVVSGILMSLDASLSSAARTGDTSVSSYSAALLIGAGVLLSTFLYTPFFLNFPVQGKAVQLSSYLQGTRQQHLLGILGGVVWMAGMLGAYTAAGDPATFQAAAQPSPVVSLALAQTVPLAAALWGVLAWREFQGTSLRVKLLLTATMILYAAGIAVVAIASLYPKQ
jgi:glucose uptake protein